jgi:hypothetical protein
MSFVLGLSLLLGAMPSQSASCARTYAPSNEIRLVNGAWQIGVNDVAQTWTALSCDPGLAPGFLGSGPDGKTLDTEGEGHVGRGSAFAIYPSLQVPAGTQFTVNPMNLFGANQIKIDLADRGWVFLDKSKYQQARSVIANVPVEIDSEPSNPEVQTALETFGTLAELFPIGRVKLPFRVMQKLFWR